MRLHLLTLPLMMIAAACGPTDSPADTASAPAPDAGAQGVAVGEPDPNGPGPINESAAGQTLPPDRETTDDGVVVSDACVNSRLDLESPPAIVVAGPEEGETVAADASLELCLRTADSDDVTYEYRELDTDELVANGGFGVACTDCVTSHTINVCLGNGIHNGYRLRLVLGDDADNPEAETDAVYTVEGDCPFLGE